MKNMVVNVFGTVVEFHWAFLLVLMFGAVTNTLLSFWLPICVITLLHEFGHIIAANLVGMRSRRILMTPLAGLAEADAPETPFKEGVFAAGGPLVNLLIMPFAWLISENVFYINLFLFILNILPIYSLDGGTILRAILWNFMSYSKATYWTVRIGQVVMVLGLSLFFYFGNVTSMIFYGLYAALFWYTGIKAHNRQIR